MKKKIIAAILFLIFLVAISLNVIKYDKSIVDSYLIKDLKGTIYFIERVDGVRTLYRSDANLTNKTLIYSHKGKGKDGYGEYNDNILDFYYDQTTETISFIAMNNGSWSLFSLKEGVKDPIFIKKQEMMLKTDYIQNHSENLTASSKKGSLYLVENGNEKQIKKFNGIYDEKFTGYHPIGFSPNGKYLVYRSMEHLTPIGSLLEGYIQNSIGQMYIMDLQTMESTKFIEAYEIQWVMD